MKVDNTRFYCVMKVDNTRLSCVMKVDNIRLSCVMKVCISLYLQACQWAVVPLTLIAVIIYTIAIRNMSLPQGHALQLAGRYYILHNDELSPLLPAENGERAERTVQVSTPVPRATETAFAPDQ